MNNSDQSISKVIEDAPKTKSAFQYMEEEKEQTEKFT